MVNKKGTTLIEVMIVLAILGIISNLPVFQDLFRQFNAQEEHLHDQENVFLFRTHLATLIKNAKRIDTAFDRQLILDNARLVVSKDHSKVFLNGKIWSFKNFRMIDFERIDDQTAICNIDNGNNKYSLYIIPGKYEQIKDDEEERTTAEESVEKTPESDESDIKESENNE